MQWFDCFGFLVGRRSQGTTHGASLKTFQAIWVLKCQGLGVHIRKLCNSAAWGGSLGVNIFRLKGGDGAVFSDSYFAAGIRGNVDDVVSKKMVLFLA